MVARFLAETSAVIAVLLTQADMRAADHSGSEAFRKAYTYSKQTLLPRSHTNLQESFSAFRELLPVVAAGAANLTGATTAEATTKRKARGYRSTEYQTAMLYFVAGKLEIPCY